MSKSILTNSQKRELIKKYQEEVVKLQYQLEKFEDIISELNKEKATKTDKKANTARRRGRPSKAKTEAVIIQAKRRGRPPKAKADTAASEPKRRGRPPKAKVDIVASQAKRRGRPRKTVSVPTVSLANELKNNTKLKNEPKKRQRIVENGYKLSDWDNFVIETLNKKQIVLITKDFIEASKLRSESEKSKFDEAKVKNMLNRSLHKLSNKRGDIIKTKYNGKGFAYALPKWVSNSSKKLKKKYQRK